MDSPALFLETLAGQRAAGTLDDESLAHTLDAFDMYLEQWALAVQRIVTPDGSEQAPKLMEMALEGLQLLWEASARMRSEEVELALALAHQGQELLSEAMVLSQEGLAELEDEP